MKNRSSNMERKGKVENAGLVYPILPLPCHVEVFFDGERPKIGQRRDSFSYEVLITAAISRAQRQGLFGDKGFVEYVLLYTDKNPATSEAKWIGACTMLRVAYFILLYTLL